MPAQHVSVETGRALCVLDIEDDVTELRHSHLGLLWVVCVSSLPLERVNASRRPGMPDQGSSGANSITMLASDPARRISPSMLPASIRSRSPARIASSLSGVSTISTWDTAALSERFAAVLLRLTAPRTSDTTSNTAGSPPAASASSEESGQLARWIDPFCHQLQTSSVTKGKKGARSRSWIERANANAARAEMVGPSVLPATCP